MKSLRKIGIVTLMVGAMVLATGCFHKSVKSEYFTIPIGDGWRLISDASTTNKDKINYVFGYYPEDQDTGVKVSISVDNADGENTFQMAEYHAKVVRQTGANALVSSAGEERYALHISQMRPNRKMQYSVCYLRSNEEKVGSICLTANKREFSSAEAFVREIEDYDKTVMPLPLPFTGSKR